MRIKRKLCFLSLVYILLLIFSIYGPWDFAGALSKYRQADICLRDGMSVSLSGQVYHKEIKSQQAIYYLKNASIIFDQGCLNDTSVILYFDSENIPNYSKINIEGTVSLFTEATNEGSFDSKAYYNSMGLVCKVTGENLNYVKAGGLVKYDILYRLSQSLSNLYNACLPGEEAGFLASVALGNKAGLNGDLKSLFQEVGVAHVLAVSGLHVSVVCMGLYSFMRKRGVSFLVSGLASAIIAIFYGALTCFSVSAIRAVGMFIIYLLAQILGEAYDMLTALALTADLLLVQNPLYIQNSSFIFSFGAVLGVVIFARPMATYYDNYCKRRQKDKISIVGLKESYNKPLITKVKEAIAGNLIFSGMLTLTTVPIVSQLFYSVPIYSTFLNLFVIPLMPYLLGLGLFGGAVGLIYYPAGATILGCCHYIIYAFELLAALFSKLPLATTITGHHYIWQLVVYYLVLVVIVHGISWIRSFSKKLMFTLILQFTAAICSAALFLIPAKHGFEVNVLDVGQGDGIYISTGKNNIFIDGGSTSSSQVGEYTILPFLKYKGVGHIDYWFISHGDLDHVSGLMELMDMDYSIKNIVVSARMPSCENWEIIKNMAKEKGINICYMSEGDQLVADNSMISCIYPDSKVNYDDINAMSLCLLLEYDENKDGNIDFTGFFGGDIAAQQEELIAGKVGKVNFLKVSHHGSKYSSAENFVSALDPDMAVISCSATNRYGHPSQEAIDRLEKYGCQIYYTMNSGRIRISSKGISAYIKN